MHNSTMKLFSGSSNVALAQGIAKYLSTDLSTIELKRFKDGEISVKLRDNVRSQDVFIIQSTCTPANDNIIELLLIIDAALRASAGRISVVMPYFGYARQDRKVEPRVPISAKVMANIIQAAGANRIVTMDLHADQIQGFFDIPVDNMFASPIALDYLRALRISDLVVVSPDTGGVERARFLAKSLNTGLAIIDKRRPETNVSEVMNVIGDVKDKNCILIDDMVDTGGSISKACIALKECGALDVYCLFTHAVLSGDAVAKMQAAGFKEIVTTNTIPIREEVMGPHLTILSIAPLLGEAIRRIHNGESISSLFVKL